MKKSNLLFKEPPLVVQPSLAKAVGLNEAIVLQQLHYWLENPKVGAERNGEKWIFNTYDEWQENFPFWSVYQIQRIFLGLEKGGLVIARQLDIKQHDAKKFYRIDYDKLCMIDDANLQPSITEKLHDDNSNTETTSETTSSTTTAPPATPNVFTVYQNNIGMLTSFTADELKDLENTFTELWVIEAIKEAVLSEVRNMKYIKSILNRWKVEGFKSAKTKSPARSGSKTSVQQDLDTLQKWVEEG